MAECGALLDDELSSFVFSYLREAENQVPGEEPLSLDFSEIDLLQLDAGDFDSSYFDELQWCGEHSDSKSSPYSTEESELFQIIDGENEALLAALTQTLDDIQEDDLDLSAFRTSCDRSSLAPPASPPNPASYAAVAAVSPPPSEADDDELSILKKLLLSPAQMPLNCDAPKEGGGRRHGVAKSRAQRTFTKAESSRDRKSIATHGQSRSCSELHKHLVSPTHVPHALPQESWDGSRSCRSPRLIQVSDSGDVVDSDGDVKCPLICNKSLPAPPCLVRTGAGPQFTCEKERKAMVGLIQYMHTYCVPPRKLHVQDTHRKQCSSLLKKAKTPTASQNPVFSSKTTFARVPRKVCSENSILKKLLAEDLANDLSKPYRLAQPAYASLPGPSMGKSPTTVVQQGVVPGNCVLKTKEQPEKTAQRQSLQPYPDAKSETSSVGQDTRLPTTSPPERVMAKVAPKQESTIYAVRRSCRLNPELGQWLSFTEEDVSEASGEEAERGVKAFCPVSGTLSRMEEVKDRRQAEHTLRPHRTDSHPPAMGFGRGRREAEEDPLFSQLTQTEECLSLPSSENGSAFGKKAFDQGLTVELCGTAGLTPPTTPPYKPADEDLFKPNIDCQSTKGQATTSSSPASEQADISGVPEKPSRKQPERTELLAHLSRAVGRPCWTEHQGTKRPLSHSFGDHDYCQVLRPETSSHRKVLKSWEPPSQLVARHHPIGLAVPKQELARHGTCGGKLEMLTTEGGKQLRDLEIRASLTKHFGYLDRALEDEDATLCPSPGEDAVFEDSGSEGGGSPAEEGCHRLPFLSKQCLQRSLSTRTSYHQRYRSLSGSRSSSCCRSRSPANRQNFRNGRHRYDHVMASPLRRHAYKYGVTSRCSFRSLFPQSEGSRCENGELGMGGNHSHWQVQRRREKAIDEGRMVYIRNLSSSMCSDELQKRFEAFGEITECRVLSRNNKGDKYGFITYRRSEHAALSLKNGASMRRRHEPAFQLSYGGLRHFWTRYMDLDSNIEELSPLAVKSKYETMDFDSLLKEAQRSLQR